MNKIFKRFLISIISIIIIIFVAFLSWTSFTYKPTQLSLDSMSSDNLVKVSDDNFIVFSPKNTTPTKGLIFYPGAKVEPQSYSSLCRKIAEEGYLVVIVPMTLNLAILSPDKAESVINNFNYIDTWVMAGHSLGGVMASDYAVKNPKVKGVVFYASYPQGDKLKNSDEKVLSIYGSLDGVANLDKINYSSLPKDFKIVKIEGGNHAQFGSYGKQSGDNDATISNEDQIKLASKYTVEFMNTL